jgi:dephospho-CoA kinase
LKLGIADNYAADEYARVSMTANSLVIGLTGNIATGKSSVLDYLARLGAYIIDADKLAHQSMTPEGQAYHAVVAEFGPAILNPDKTINRKALGQIVFRNADGAAGGAIEAADGEPRHG